MKDFQVGTRVRILQNTNLVAFDRDRAFEPIYMEDLQNQSGIVRPGRGSVANHEVLVKLDNGRRVIIEKRHLDQID